MSEDDKERLALLSACSIAVATANSYLFYSSMSIYQILMEHSQKTVPFVSINFETVSLELSPNAPVSVYRLAVQEPIVI